MLIPSISELGWASIIEHPLKDFSMKFGFKINAPL